MIVSKHFDRIAIALSAVCIVHCLAVPVLVALVPIAAVSMGGASHFHALMLWFVVPTSFVGLGLGLRIHRRMPIVLLGAIGIAILAAAATWGHSTWSEPLEVSVSVAGSLILGLAHWLNFKQVRRLHRH